MEPQVTMGLSRYKELEAAEKILEEIVCKRGEKSFPIWEDISFVDVNAKLADNQRGWTNHFTVESKFPIVSHWGGRLDK